MKHGLKVISIHRAAAA